MGFVTVKEASERYGRTEDTIRAWAKCKGKRYKYNTPEERIEKVWRNTVLTQVGKYTCIQCGEQYN